MAAVVGRVRDAAQGTDGCEERVVECRRPRDEKLHTGHRGALWICIVAHCRDGKITRIDEYMDSSKFPAWMGGAK